MTRQKHEFLIQSGGQKCCWLQNGSFCATWLVHLQFFDYWNIYTNDFKGLSTFSIFKFTRCYPRPLTFIQVCLV